MDYFSVIILVIVTFVFISDRNIKSIDKIKNEQTELDILQQIEIVKENLEIVKVNTKDMNYINILKIIQKYSKSYILLQNDDLELNNNKVDILVANYISKGKTPCGFNLLYVYQEKKWSLKNLYIDIINYLNIFNKNDLSTYGVIICKKGDFAQKENSLKDKLISYTPNEIMHIQFGKEKIKTDHLKTIYINKIKEANFYIIIRIFLLIISGSIITTNLIYSILNVNTSINGLIISGVIYYCYSYIIRYIYKPIGTRRILATYIFPVYFIVYIVIGLYVLIAKVIKKVHAS